MQITMGGQKVCWKLERAHSSLETMLFWAAAGFFDRLRRVRAQEEESSAFSDNCLVFIPRNVWRVSG